jgi:hypothetical protein
VYVQRKHKIGGSLESDPDRLGSGETVTFSIEEAAEAGDHADHLIERWRRLRGQFALSDQIDRLPFGRIEHDVTRHFGTVTPEHGEQQHAPSDDHVERERWFQSFERLQLQLFNTTAAFENSEENLSGKGLAR